VMRSQVTDTPQVTSQVRDYLVMDIYPVTDCLVRNRRVIYLVMSYQGIHRDKDYQGMLQGMSYRVTGLIAVRVMVVVTRSQVRGILRVTNQVRDYRAMVIYRVTDCPVRNRRVIYQGMSYLGIHRNKDCQGIHRGKDYQGIRRGKDCQGIHQGKDCQGIHRGTIYQIMENQVTDNYPVMENQAMDSQGMTYQKMNQGMVYQRMNQGMIYQRMNQGMICQKVLNLEEKDEAFPTFQPVHHYINVAVILDIPEGIVKQTSMNVHQIHVRMAGNARTR